MSIEVVATSSGGAGFLFPPLCQSSMAWPLRESIQLVQKKTLFLEDVVFLLGEFTDSNGLVAGRLTGGAGSSVAGVGVV